MYDEHNTFIANIHIAVVCYDKFCFQEEMLIFMEFCAEGTLESLVAGSGNGLPESLVRKYTHQLLSAVAALHSHGIVHRDIKSNYLSKRL